MLLEVLSAFVSGQLEYGQTFIDDKGTSYELVHRDQLRITSGGIVMEFISSVLSQILPLPP